MTEPQVVAVFGSSATEPDSPAWDRAERLGGELVEAGLGVVTGGYGGSMEAVSKGAAGAGGLVVGVTAPVLFPHRSGANPHVGTLIEADSLTGRIGTMVDMACGVIALPGSIGTATELLIAWNVNHHARYRGSDRRPTVAVGEGWRRLHEAMTAVGAFPHDVEVSGTVDEALSWLLEQPEINRHLATR